MEPSFTVFDLESTDLNGSFGHVLCTVFCEASNESCTVYRLDDSRYRGENLSDDSKLVRVVKKHLEDSFAWVSWNGKLFDIPMLNARLVKNGENPISKRIHVDAMYYFRRPFMALHSSKLEEVARTFKFRNQKVKLDPNTWVAAYELKGWAMDEVVDHCKADVLALREAFLLAVPHLKNLHY